jgi:hypothetical protein
MSVVRGLAGTGATVPRSVKAVRFALLVAAVLPSDSDAREPVKKRISKLDEVFNGDRQTLLARIPLRSHSAREALLDELLETHFGLLRHTYPDAALSG